MIKLSGVSGVIDQLNKSKEVLEGLILSMMTRRGEQFLSDCRNERTYQDQTGNLRASLGYFVFKGNTLLVGDGDETARSVLNEIPKDAGVYYLIGVAGMNYAAAVEAKGYNVISNQTIQIIDLLKGDLESLKNKL
jgi:hypothetical protein